MRKIKTDSGYSNQQLEKELKRTLMKSRQLTRVKGVGSALLIFAAVLVLVTTIWFPVYHVTGDSMNPVLERGMIVVASRGASVTRGDIVAAYYNNRIMIRRLIGMPGDLIHIDETGRVYINGSLLREYYVSEPSFEPTNLTYPIQVPEDSFFLMGDRRDGAADSRLSSIGCVEADKYAGKIIVCIWPLQRIGILR